MNQTTLSRLLESVFSGGEFSPQYTSIKNDDINKVLERLPFSLSKSQRDAIFRALKNDISYIQGPLEQVNLLLFLHLLLQGEN